MEDKKAIIFDFDGTLAKTMDDNFLAWEESFREQGIDISKEDFFPLEGAKLEDIVKSLAEKYNLKNPQVETIIRKKEEVFKKINKFSLYPGVSEFLNSLKNDISISIVSGARKERLFSTTPIDFLKKFDLIVTSDYLKNFKPHPDPFLHALEKLKLSPNDCIVIENAPLGIQSAKSAGIYCIAIASTMDKLYLNEADEIIGKFDELKNLEIIQPLLKQD
ncbi:MAG: HAD family phosphatase [Nanoarchaeota archaeon]|nr:HAD family phosphatase [Nanoarchaeota archaeon]